MLGIWETWDVYGTGDLTDVHPLIASLGSRGIIQKRYENFLYALWTEEDYAHAIVDNIHYTYDAKYRVVTNIELLHFNAPVTDGADFWYEYLPRVARFLELPVDSIRYAIARSNIMNDLRYRS
jgi:hypothetical protein